MNSALWKLFWLRVRGSVRSIVGKVKSVRGAALVLFTVLVFSLMVGPNVVIALTHKAPPPTNETVEGVRIAIAVGLLLYCLFTAGSSLGERAIYFSPSEIDFLFPGPFSRRELLLYKILGNVFTSAFLAVVFATSAMTTIRSWPAAVVGIFLAWLLVTSVTMCAQLVVQCVSERIFTRARRLLAWTIVGVVAVALGQTVARGLDGSWQETLKGVVHWPAVKVVLAPFDVYGRIITAERLVPDAIGWAALAAILVVGVYAVAIRLDANYLETAVRVSQLIQERQRRALKEGVFSHRSKRAVRSTRLPQFPWLGGVGPVAWRQAIQAARGSRGGIVFAVIILVAIVAPMVLGIRKVGELQTVLPAMIVGGTAYLTLLVAAQTPLGFRGDYERMELLKSLPIRPVAMACSQIAVVAAIFTVFQWFVCAVTVGAFPGSAAWVLMVAPFAVPMNWLLFGTEDLLFLLYPSPLISRGSEGLLKVGRMMLFMLLKFLVLGVCAGVAAVPALGVYFLTGSVLAACAVAWCALVIPMGVLLALDAWAFERYDVTFGPSD